MYYILFFFKAFFRYIFVVLPCILVTKSIFDCYNFDTWTFTYFIQYFLSHVPFIGFFLLNNFYSDILLSFKLLTLHEQFSKYLFVGSIGASLGRVLLEIYSDLYCMMEQDQGGVGQGGAGQGQNPVQPAQNPVQPVQNPVQPAQNPVQPAQNPVQPAQNPVQPPQNNYPPFRLINNRYTIADPTGVANRGFINPQNGMPYPNLQPYLSNLLAALENQAHLHGGPTVALHSNRWGAVEWRFLSEYMEYNYPNRAEHQWWNSKPVRDAIRRAP